MPRWLHNIRRLRRQPLTILLIVIIIIVCISAASYQWLATMMQLMRISSSSSFSYSSSYPRSSDGVAFIDRVKLKSQPSSILDTNAVNNNILSPSSLLRATVLPIVTNATPSSSTKVTTPTNISSSSHKKRRKRRSGGMHICHCLADSFNTSIFGPRQSSQQPLDNRDDTFTSQVLLRWLHIPKTGTSFISTLWNIMTSSTSSNNNHNDRYIDLNVHSYSCDNYYTARYYSMYDFVLMRRYPWEMYGLLTSTTNRRIPKRTPKTIPTTSTAAAAQQRQFINMSLSFGLVGGTQHQPLGSEILHQQHNNNFTTIIAAFFRNPKERITSAYYDNRHANGLTSEQYKELYKMSTPPPPMTTTTMTTKLHGSKQHQQQQKQQQQQQTFQPCIYHSNNNNTNNSTITTSYTNPLACFANYPGIAGCAARMLSGETCADGIHQHNGTEHIPNSLDVITNKLHFIGLTEEWDESICQFHHLLFGNFTRQQQQQQQQWKNHIHHPQQGEFSNVHSSPSQHKMYNIETHLHDFIDVADTIIYNAAKLRFEHMVNNSGGRCHRYMTWDEIDNATQTKLLTNDDDEDVNYGVNNNILSSLLPTDEDGYICEPMSCSDLGKQCGEYDDKCGKTVICGLCDPGRTGLPSTWRVKCVDGQCVDYCPPWDDSGFWSLSSSSSSSSSSTNEDRLLLSSSLLSSSLSSSETMIKKIGDILGILQDGKQHYLSPVDAVMICEIACNKTITHHDEWLVENFINTGLCHCGTTASILSKNLTLHDFSKAHGMAEACNLSKARRYAVLTMNETQPICCPYIDQQVKVPTNWRKLGALSKFNVEGEYYDHIMLGCGAFVECELVARERGAELAVFDLYNKMCYLARNVFDLKNMYTITKDNAMRYSIDLRK